MHFANPNPIPLVVPDAYRLRDLQSLGCGGNVFRPPDLYEKRVSYPKAIIQNILALQRATKKKSPKKAMAYQQAKPAAAPKPASPKAAPAESGAVISVSTTSFKNESPAASRTTAHAPAAQPAGVSSADSETERRRAQGQANVSGQPDWVKDAKNQQEKNDFVAAKEWMEAVTGEPFVNEDLWETTKSGVYLCKLINKVKPGTVKKYSKMSPKLPFKCMENITFYIEGCEKLGMRASNTFRPPDLYEKRVSYPRAIVNNIHALARLAKDMSDYKGPQLQVELSSGKGTEFF